MLCSSIARCTGESRRNRVSAVKRTFIQHLRLTQLQTDKDGSVGNSVEAFQLRLEGHLPPSKHGSVPVTSRTWQAAMQLVEDSDIILIEPMDEAAAHALLHKKLGDKGKQSDSNSDSSNDVAKLAAALDQMPFALVQAAAYVRQRAPQCSVLLYLEEFWQSGSRSTVGNRSAAADGRLRSAVRTLSSAAQSESRSGK